MQRILTRFLFVFVQPVSPSRQCNYALPSHPTLLFSFHAQRASATPEMKLTILISHLGRAFLLCGDSQNVRTPTPFSFFVCTPT